MGKTRTVQAISARARERGFSVHTGRLRGAISALGSELPVLGRHLARSIRTATFCAYRPDGEVRWRVDGRSR